MERAEAILRLTQLQSGLDDLGYVTALDDDICVLRAERPEVEALAPVLVRLTESPAEGLNLLHCGAIYDLAPEGDDRARVTTAAAIVNRHMTVGHVQVDDDGTVASRWTVVVSVDDDLDQERVVMAVALFDLYQQHYGDYLQGVAEGEIDVDSLDDLIAEAGDAL